MPKRPPMTLEQASRLLTLAYFLKTEVPEKKFAMRYYYTRNGLGSRDILDALQDNSCGTTACAMGWCPIVFPKDWSAEFNVPSLKGNTKRSRDRYERQNGCINDPEYYFGLTATEAAHLFYKGSKRTPKQEAKEIEKIVRKHGYTYA